MIKLLFIFLLLLYCYHGNNLDIKKSIYLQKRDWFNLTLCHKAYIGQREEIFFHKQCSGKLLLKDKNNNINNYFKPKAAQNLLKKAVRREFRCLSRMERRAFGFALNKMKRTMAGSYSEYDNFVIRHDFENAPGAHYGPAFLGWHRHFLLSLEQAIRKHCPYCSVPYWDNRLEKRLDLNHQGSILFSEYLMGNGQGPITSGPAANWSTVGRNCIRLNPKVSRHIENSNSFLFNEYDANTVMANNLKDISTPWNSYFEDIHGSVHMYFGAKSAMGPVNCSPNDPIFFLHHCFLDKLYENFRNHIKEKGNKLIYPSTKRENLPTWFRDSNNLEKNHAPNKTMAPFDNIKNIDGLISDDYLEFYYDYENSPGDVKNCKSDLDCCPAVRSEFIWCEKKSGKCVSKVKEGSRMNSDYPNNACYCPGNKKSINRNSLCICE